MFVVTLIALVGQEVERPLTCPLNLCDRTPFFSSYPIFSGTGIDFFLNRRIFNRALLENENKQKHKLGQR